MRGFYRLPSSSGISPDASPQDAEDTQFQSPQPAPAPLRSHTGLLINQYRNLGFEGESPEQIVFQEAKAHSGRSRKRSSPGVDHVKHRRTRSGCYTCRTRRVKCDENRPVCDRCRKGRRECAYPDPPTGPKGAPSIGSTSTKDATSTSQDVSPEPSIEDGDEYDKDIKLESIPDEDEPADLSPIHPATSPGGQQHYEYPTPLVSLPKNPRRQASETPSVDGAKSSSSPSMSTGTPASFNTSLQQQLHTLNTTNPGWAHLPPDLQFHMAYFRENITHFNYGIPNDPDGFFRSILPAIAVHEGNDALLYAVVGFSAYHSMLRNPHGKIQDFLEYYNKSVQLLINTLTYKPQHDLATLLAILQLATVEEYLGDWVNLAGHQNAAMRILTQLFTADTIMKSPVSALLTWYIRFDIFVAMLGGFNTSLPRDWVAATVAGSQERVRGNPDDVAWRIEIQAAALRMISTDMSLLYAKSARDEISPEDFAREYADISMRLSDWKTKLDPRITDATYLVTDFPYKQPLTEDDIVDPYRPGFLYRGPLFPTTVLLLKWHSVTITHMSRHAGYALHQEPPHELRRLAFSACQVYETIRRWPETPSGVTMTTQSSLAMSGLFLPRDQRHSMWIRRRYACMEAAGYVFPAAMRARTAEIFHDPSCSHWWLPNDEGFVPILRSIRAFADARDDNSPVTEQTEALREMSAVFANMRIADDDHGGGGGPGGGGGGGGGGGVLDTINDGPISPGGGGMGPTAPTASAKRKGKNVRGR